MAMSSLVVWAPGTVLTGAVLTAVTGIATVSVSARVPPVPVLPRSLVRMTSASGPLKPVFGA